MTAWIKPVASRPTNDQVSPRRTCVEVEAGNSAMLFSIERIGRLRRSYHLLIGATVPAEDRPLMGPAFRFQGVVNPARRRRQVAENESVCTNPIQAVVFVLVPIPLVRQDSDCLCVGMHVRVIARGP